MDLTIEVDERDRLICTIEQGDSRTALTAAIAQDAVTDLAAAIDRLSETGWGECYWRESTGDYRWVFRRADDRVRLAILWSTGTMTGWEQRFWAELELGLFVAQVRGALQQISAPA